MKCLFLILSYVAFANSNEIRSIKLDSFKFDSLADPATAFKASSVLSNLGIFKISDIPNLSEAQNESFKSLSSCMSKGYLEKRDGIYETSMDDGSKRLTIGAKTSKGVLGEFTNDCAKSSKRIQSVVDSTTKKLFQALDLSQKVRHQDGSYTMKPYNTLTDVMNNGEHLEHLHSFYNSKVSTMSDMKKAASKMSENLESKLTLKMHTDLGLLIAMTTGYYNSKQSGGVTNKRGLFITMPNQEIVHVDETDLKTNDLIIMVGQGASDWFDQKSGLNFKPVRHALIVDLGDDKDATRNWYGKMFQPPLDAEVTPGLTYGEFRGQTINAAIEQENLLPNFSKGNLRTTFKFQEIYHSTAPKCNASSHQVACWMECQVTTGWTCLDGSNDRNITCINSAGEEKDGGWGGYLGCVGDVTTKVPSSAPVSKSPVASQQSSSESSSSDGCFAGTESLTTESGATVTMNQVKIGDMVMVSSKDGRTSFSPVIVVPHPLNSEKTQFVQLTTEFGRDIKMTPNHLIMSGTCGNVQSLKEASVVKMGECITTVTGIELVTDSKTVNGAGIYTVVTASDALLVVNGVVVSPFASNHMVANSFYNIHRFIYKLVPYMASHTVTAKIMKAFGDIMMSVTSV